MTRKITSVLLGCLVLAGCGASSWQGELRFKVTEISGEVEVGDEVICTARQEKDGPIQTNSIETRLSGCKKA